MPNFITMANRKGKKKKKLSIKSQGKNFLTWIKPYRKTRRNMNGMTQPRAENKEKFGEKKKAVMKI